MNISHIDLNLLRVFEAVYAEKNVTRAALRLGISQPTISNAMSRLRQSMDDPLFVRTSHGMEPTALATKLAEPIRQALELLTKAFEEPEVFDPQVAQNTFRVLMSDAGESAIMPILMPHLNRMAPGIRIHTMLAQHDAYASIMEEGAADLAIGNLRFLLKTGFYQQRLYNDPYLCICSPDHPLAKGKRITLEQYVRFPHVGIIGSNADAFIDKALAKHRMSRNIQLKLTNCYAAVQLVRDSHFLATVPLKITTKDTKAFELPFDVPTADVRQFWHLRLHHDPANMWLRSVLADFFASHRGQ